MILIQELAGIGFKGELVKLKRGHGRILIDQQDAVYASDFNKQRFMVEVPEEEVKRREEKRVSESLQKRFSKTRVELVRTEDLATPGTHTKGVSVRDVQAYLDRHHNMDVPSEYIQIPEQGIYGFGTFEIQLEVAKNFVPIEVTVKKWVDPALEMEEDAANTGDGGPDEEELAFNFK